MVAEIISGKEIAETIRVELKKDIAELKEQKNMTPGLAVILVGEDPASQVYVNQKSKGCYRRGHLFIMNSEKEHRRNNERPPHVDNSRDEHFVD